MGIPAQNQKKSFTDSLAEDASSILGPLSNVVPGMTQEQDAALSGVGEILNSGAHEAPPAPDFPGTPGEESSSLNLADGTNTETDLMRYLFPPENARGGSNAALMDEGANYLPLGGEEGKDNLDTAYRVAPGAIAEGVQRGADAEDAEAQQTVDWLNNERQRQESSNAQIEKNRRLYQDNVDSQFNGIVKETQKYTNDLADTGKFWRNPANIMGAFGAALIAFASADKSVGVKIINNAIAADLHNRRQLADFRLGELKSNLSAYHQIAGDKITGDMLAEAEAKRTAAMDLQRIATSFKGEKAQAHAQAIIGQLMMEAQVGYMNAYKSGVYNAPRIVQKPILQSYQRGGQQYPGVGYTPYGQTNQAAQPQAARPSTSTGMRGGNVGNAGTGNAGALAASYGDMPQQLKKSIEGRVGQGASAALQAVKADIERQSLTYGPKGSPAYLAERRRIENEVRTDMTNMPPPGEVAVRRGSMNRIQSDIQLLESAYKAYNLDPDAEMTSLVRTAAGSSTSSKIDNLLASASAIGGKTFSDAQRQQIRSAQARIRQLVSGEVNAYYKVQGGSAITENELPRLQEYANAAAPWTHIKNFLNNESGKIDTEVQNNLSKARNSASRILYLNRMGINPGMVQVQPVQAKKSDVPHEHKQPVRKK